MISDNNVTKKNYINYLWLIIIRFGKMEKGGDNYSIRETF